MTNKNHINDNDQTLSNTMIKVCRLHKQEDIRVETESVGLPSTGEVLVNVAYGGICGSDLHYYLHGGIGQIVVKEPIIPGHEFSGVIAAIGEGVTEIKVGDKVAINPSHPCGECEYCQQDLSHHCVSMKFLGSAMFFPHSQGGFREKIIVDAKQCYKAPQSLSLDKLAIAEPLAVVLHAMQLYKHHHDARHEDNCLANKKVLITGAGPIGCLVAAVAKQQQASEVVISDLFDQTLSVAKQMGADKTHNIHTDKDTFAIYEKNKGYFDVVFECSSSPIAIADGLRLLKPKGMFIQVGMSGEINFPMNYIIGKEITLVGSFRFDKEFDLAVEYLSTNKIDVSPMITQSFSIDDVETAFHTAKDRSQSVKVLMQFNPS